MTEAYNMDCMEYMKTVPDKYFDIAIVDPPYGGGANETTERFGGKFDRYKAEAFSGNAPKISATRTGGTWAAKYGKNIATWDIAPGEDYFKELFRVSKNQIIWGGNYFKLPPTRCFIAWRKTNIPVKGFTMSPVEYAWTSFDRSAYVAEVSAQGQPDRFHPTMKPVELYEWCIETFCKDGDKILDTHLGTGTSRLAAYNKGFDFVGTELNKYYFDKQEERFAKYSAQTNIFEIFGKENI